MPRPDCAAILAVSIGAWLSNTSQMVSPRRNIAAGVGWANGKVSRTASPWRRASTTTGARASDGAGGSCALRTGIVAGGVGSARGATVLDSTVLCGTAGLAGVGAVTLALRAPRPLRLRRDCRGRRDCCGRRDLGGLCLGRLGLDRLRCGGRGGFLRNRRGGFLGCRRRSRLCALLGQRGGGRESNSFSPSSARGLSGWTSRM